MTLLALAGVSTLVVMSGEMCERCGVKPAGKARGPVSGLRLCRAGYEYERRNGEVRPLELIHAQWERDEERRQLRRHLRR